MNEEVREPFCPLYQEAIQASPWDNPASAHTGLLFDKFASAWRFKRDRADRRVHPVELEFDKGKGPKKERAGQWLSRFKRPVGDAEQLAEACSRQRTMIESLGGKVVLVKNIDRFVTGMGRPHPLENGFVWHPTLGVPFLPGSSLKGMLRAWLRETEGELESDQHGNPTLIEDVAYRTLFGEQSAAGKLIHFDILPLTPPTLDVDIMTPHYSPYYQKQEIPGDWHSPMPISFLTVATEQSWQVGLAPAPRTDPVSADKLQSLIDALLDGLEIAGGGAKTAVGYGRFVRDQGLEDWQRAESEKRQNAEETARQAAAELAAFESSLASDSEPLQQLKQLQRQQDWQASAGDHNLVKALQDLVTHHPDPPADCLEWIRELLESIPNYAGVWDDPEAKKGKKKDKSKYPSATIRELVKRLNPKLH